MYFPKIRAYNGTFALFNRAQKTAKPIKCHSAAAILIRRVRRKPFIKSLVSFKILSISTLILNAPSIYSSLN